MRNWMLIAAAAGVVSACSDASDVTDAQSEQSGAYQDGSEYGAAYAEAPQQYTQMQPPQGSPAAMQPQMQAQMRPNSPPVSNGMQLVKIIDRNGFEQPMVAYIKEIPAGWTTQGGVNWQMNNAGCGKTVPALEWRATSPDGASDVTILPAEQWTGHNLPYAISNTCPNVQITDTKQFIIQYAQRLRPGARILDYRDRTSDAQELQSQMPAPQRDPYGNETRMWVGAGQALVGYNVNGVEMREIIGTSVIFSLMRSPDPIQGGSTDFISIMSMPGFAMRAPEGKLDFELAERIRKSGKGNPAYEQKMAAYYARNNKIQADSNAKIAAINRKGAADRSAIIAKSGQDISDIQMSIYRSQSASSDYIGRESSEAIRGVETYNDQYNGGTVELDNTYNYNWQLENGDIVQTNDANFNVYENTGQFGSEMEVTE